jgi:NADH-quinone oxidoreductase subunit J
MEQFLFYFLSSAMLLCGVLVITSKNPVNSAIFLILVFFFMAGLFVLLHAFFLAAVQVLVYAGAVMVLFLFVIMLLNIKSELSHHLHWFGVLGSLLVIPILIWEFTKILREDNGNPLVSDTDVVGSTEAVGRLLFSNYLLPFEIASILLLMAMIGVIVLSKKDAKVQGAEKA